MKYDRFQDQLNIWFLWVGALTIGCAVGWASGEALGRVMFQTYGWTIGHAVGWCVFELSVWTMRWQVLRRVSTVPMWRRMDTMLWFSSELIAWAIGEGIHQLTTTIWVTASGVWGLISGASIWFALACARQAKAGRWFVLTGTLYGLLGVFGAILFTPAILIMATEVQRVAESSGVPVLGWLAGGAIVGASTGAMTGLAVARLWLRLLTPD